MDLKQRLLTPHLDEAAVEVAGLGTVTVRALNRWELLAAGKTEKQGVAAMERAILAFAMVDPTMTEDEVGQWQKAAPPGEIQPVLARVNELSGIGQSAAKEAYKSVPDESRS
ncbi:hypothetical protein [Micromonospora wenchangensis]|uniref:hypothetical protein n=1 Tax=Micromonospora wenchangensis TaxID=1185415 RepID=UPI00381DAE7D